MAAAGVLPEDAKLELLDGVLYRTTRSELHNAIVSALADAFRALRPDGCHVREEKPSRDGEYSMPGPDVAVCAGGVFSAHPDLPSLTDFGLVAEVCLGTEQADRVVKLARYAAAGVPAYWIVDAESRRVEVYRSPSRSAARYQALATYKPGDMIPAEIDDEVLGTVAVNDLFPPPRT